MQIHEVSLAKKTVITEDRTYLLWENVGRSLVEAQLTAQQIQQVFQQAEQGSTAAGGNRTGLGQVKDASSEVAKAWNDLKSKVQNSGPVRNIDALYDQAAEKLKQATGGDQGVMKYVEKYRKFAKEHPIAQSFIYAALIAAAGISGAGAGGAAALGLLKMTDKLLQGEKFSSAAYAGAKTGALAYGAGQLGKAMHGGEEVTTSSGKMFFTDGNRYYQAQLGSNGQPIGDIMVANQVYSPTDPNYQTAFEYLLKASKEQAKQQAAVATDINVANFGQFKESQINKAFYLAAGLQTQLNEGMWDSIKGAAGRAAGAVGKWAATKGHNLTTRVTADKLMSA